MSTDKPSSNTSLFDRFLNLIGNFNLLFCSVALVVLTVIFGWLVFGRYVLNDTPTWVEQVSLLLVVYIGFLGASVGIHKKTHLGVSVFREISPRPVQRLFELMSHVIMTGFGLVMVIYGYKLTVFRWPTEIPLIHVVMVIYGYKLTVFRWPTEIPLIHVTEGLRAIPIMLSGICIVLFSIGHLIHFFKDPADEETS